MHIVVDNWIPILFNGNNTSPTSPSMMNKRQNLAIPLDDNSKHHIGKHLQSQLHLAVELPQVPTITEMIDQRLALVIRVFRSED